MPIDQGYPDHREPMTADESAYYFGEPLSDDEARCQCCGERVLKVATKPMDNGDTFCLECAADVEAEDTDPAVQS